MNPEIVDTMVRAAMQVMDNAYVPYGKAAIGACVLASDGTFYTGCNIENAIPRLSVFAEEVAMYRAVADGKREFDAIAIIADTEEPFIPNGAVCQLLAEFDVQEIIMTNMDGVVKTAKLSDLLPNAKAPMDNALRPTEE
ncbi:MAG: cytidine deaminase [Selenomonas sp.]|jgi:cytidine deaminase|uniref:cytidine deaminase n=1 Tax=Selenomonas sp. AE3005 TaxID=1485543 RepID=UPI000486EC3D|nr:cytidine deaminase [Selenomonas sp. AE3005]MBQ1416015.1 cytidine deaminase [Selenomonas sp.]MBQ2087680.1 cytidine deaminase [Selenomonas sp.]MBQ2137308.1 cytidine deaminase [Selenomonas sp.]MBQ4213178.1 cytidine deaminase [Selenomonas sp.]MBQ5419221.1 cytidine deaminase [Selenomonas sp.]